MGKENHLFWQMGDSKSHSLVKASSPTNQIPNLSCIAMENHPWSWNYTAEFNHQAMSASQTSTISYQSVYSKNKRKRDTNYTFEHTRPTLKFKMVIVDINETFKQLCFARYGQGPYNNFESWNDSKLWVELVKVLQKQLCIDIDLQSIISLILDYAKRYDDDPSVGWIKDNPSLKNYIYSVFRPAPLEDTKGCLSVNKIKEIQGDYGPYEQLCESSNIHRGAGRLKIKRTRSPKSSSSSGVGRALRCSERFEDTDPQGGGISALPNRLVYLREAGYMSIPQLQVCMDHFFYEKQGSNKDIRGIMFLALSLEDQVTYINNLFR